MTTPTDTKAKKDDVLRKVRAALALAESERELGHEDAADAHTATAARLMAKYGIDETLAKARAHVRATPADKLFTIDAPYSGAKGNLLHVIARALHCQAITIRTRGPQGRVHVFGFESDIELTELLYTSLLLQMSSATARMHIPSYLRGREVMAERRSFMLGFSAGVRPRLEEAYALAVAEADDTGTPGTALVLVGRDVQVKDAYHAAYPNVRIIRPTSTGGGFGAGHAAGQRANIHDRPGVRSGSREIGR